MPGCSSRPSAALPVRSSPRPADIWRSATRVEPLLSLLHSDHFFTTGGLMRNASRLCTPGPSLLSVLLLCVPALCVFASPSGAPKLGQASGSFSVDGTAVALRYAYAMVQP